MGACEAANAQQYKQGKPDQQRRQQILPEQIPAKNGRGRDARRDCPDQIGRAKRLGIAEGDEGQSHYCMGQDQPQGDAANKCAQIPHSPR